MEPEIWFQVLVVLVAFLSPHGSQGSDLPISKACGEDLTCNQHEFCRPVDHSCQPCHTVCNVSNHNFDQTRCEAGCQDYLHDERYLRVGSGGGCPEDLKGLSELLSGLEGDVVVLKVLVASCLLLVCLTIGSFLAALLYFKRALGPKDPNPPSSHKKPLDLATVYNNKYGVSESGQVSPLPSLKESGQDSGNNTSSPVKSDNSTSSVRTCPGTMSTILNNSLNGSLNNSVNKRVSGGYRREPSESTLPECGYDNTSLHNPYTSHHV